MNDLELTVIDLLGEAIKHGKHNQASHGRRTARRRAYSAAYSQARAGGASPAEARAKAREAGLARQSERDVRLERLRETLNKPEVQESRIRKENKQQYFDAEANKPLTDAEKQKVDMLVEGIANPSPRYIGDTSRFIVSPKPDVQIERAIDFERQNRNKLLEKALWPHQFRDALSSHREMLIYQEAKNRRDQSKEEKRKRDAEFSTFYDRVQTANRLQTRLDRGSKLTKADRTKLEEIRGEIVKFARKETPRLADLTDEDVYRYARERFTSTR